jgi:indolepyruvate decarboxylase
MDPETAADEIIRVVETMRAQCRPGYLEIPYDVVDMPIKLPTIRNTPAPESDKENLEAALAEAAEKIKAAKQPVIVLDVELHRHGLTNLAVSIAEKFNIPIASTLLSKSIVSENHPFYIGVYSGGLSEQVTQDYVEGSDCLILLGAFLSDVFMGMHTATLDRKRTILANTEKTRIGLHSYENVLFKDFLEGLKAQDIPKRVFKNPYHAAEIVPLADKEKSDALDSESFFRILSLHMDKTTTLVCDTGDSLLGAIGLRTDQSNNFLSDAYYLSMGFAMPAAIGAMVAGPEDRVIAIIGDGAFQMTGIEISTAAKYRMNPIVCILNNDGYGTQRHIIDGPFNNIHRWEYAKLRDVLNYGKSYKVTTKGELDNALANAVQESDTMHLIEVIIPRDDCSRPLRRMASKLGELRDASKRK